MILSNMYKDTKYEIMGQYYCDISKFLDYQADIESDSRQKHYILARNYFLKERCLPIRVPGGTVGGIRIDSNNVITKIVVDTGYVIKTYPKNINDLMQKFVGEKIEFEA